MASCKGLDTRMPLRAFHSCAALPVQYRLLPAQFGGTDHRRLRSPAPTCSGYLSQADSPLPLFYHPVPPPDIVASEVDVFPAQRGYRKVRPPFPPAVLRLKPANV